MRDSDRWGIAMPPDNPTVAREMATLLGEASVLVDRFDARPDLDLAGRLVAYRENSEPVVSRLCAAGATAIGLACTGSSYDVGLAGDAAWRDRLTEQFHRPVHSAASATFDLLTAFEVAAVTIASPYPAWLSERCAAFWDDAGFDVLEVFPIHNDDVIYATSVAAVDTALAAAYRAAAGHTSSAVVVAGTGAATLASIEAVAALALPIVSSNIALAWALHSSVALSDAGTIGRLVEGWSFAAERGT
jgi:maleate isomerase